ncbi:hypothetical protein [Pasteurella multocida]|uniref:hypothetical protein n=1 Tax=Pasteurella multocida TaxID=747 RepID=UPI002B4A3B44|nr:hypothetical protein [Pasteurella multocida]WRK03701.1 hypothetical protein RFF39_03370 [Pasteurella multocida]HDR1800314.1 hypothetical protein [Pasteurella multocida]
MNQRLGYVGDRAIFEALMQSKITADLTRDLFLNKGIISSSRETKEDLARYYSSLPISYNNHKQIEDKMAVRKRREKMSYIELIPQNEVQISPELLRESIEEVKNNYESKGFKISYNEINGNHCIEIERNKIDYALSELMQNRLETSSIMFEKESNSYIARSTQLDTSTTIRDEIIETLIIKHQQDENGSTKKCEISPFEISLSHISDSQKRTCFLISLMRDKLKEVANLKLLDVLQAGVHKCYNETTEEDSETLSATLEQNASRLRSVLFKGSGIHLSKEITELGKNGFYYIKAVFVLEEISGPPHRYEIEVEFKDADECKKFSYILKSVSYFEKSNKREYSKGKAPQESVQNTMLRHIEKAAKLALESISHD